MSNICQSTVNDTTVDQNSSNSKIPPNWDIVLKLIESHSISCIKIIIKNNSFQIFFSDPIEMIEERPDVSVIYEVVDVIKLHKHAIRSITVYDKYIVIFFDASTDITITKIFKTSHVKMHNDNSIQIIFSYPIEIIEKRSNNSIIGNMVDLIKSNGHAVTTMTIYEKYMVMDFDQ